MRWILPAFCLVFGAAGRASGLSVHGDLFDGRGTRAPALSFLPVFNPAAAILDGRRPTAPTVAFNGIDLKTYLFSDEDRIADPLAAAIGRTRSTLRAALHGLSIPELADALIAAKDRGVDVQVIMDYKHMVPDADDLSQERSHELDRLIASGVDLRVLKGAGARGLMHNKFVLLDGRLLKTGSFNWSKHANTVHYENAVFRDDEKLIAGFSAYWLWMWDQAKPPAQAAESLDELRGSPPVDGSPSLMFKGRAWPSYAFSPRGGTEERLIEAVSLCEASIDIAMFSFTSKGIAESLLAAKNRGVTVRIVMDRSQSGGDSSRARFFAENGFDLKLLSGMGPDGRQHNKFGLYDGELLETGSYNYTFNASVNNFENSVFSTTPADLAGYRAAFERLYALGKPATAADLEISALDGSGPAY